MIEMKDLEKIKHLLPLKIYVTNESEYNQVQTILFTFGYKWVGDSDYKFFEHPIKINAFPFYINISDYTRMGYKAITWNEEVILERYSIEYKELLNLLQMPEENKENKMNTIEREIKKISFNLPFNILVKNKDESKIVQNKLFGLGWKWTDTGKNYFNPYLHRNDFSPFYIEVLGKELLSWSSNNIYPSFGFDSFCKMLLGGKKIEATGKDVSDITSEIININELRLIQGGKNMDKKEIRKSLCKVTAIDRKTDTVIFDIDYQTRIVDATDSGWEDKLRQEMKEEIIRKDTKKQYSLSGIQISINSITAWSKVVETKYSSNEDDEDLSDDDDL